MRGERDHESGDSRHHGAGQRHGCRGHAGRIAAGLLTPDAGNDAASQPNSKMQFIKCYLMVRLIHGAYSICERPYRACLTQTVSSRRARAAYATPFFPRKAGGAVRLFFWRNPW
jgi:hypothetical protein